MNDERRVGAEEAEEDLTKGPIPEVRRAEGEPERPHDQTEGPTPETREADRRAEEGRAS